MSSIIGSRVLYVIQDRHGRFATRSYTWVKPFRKARIFTTKFSAECALEIVRGRTKTDSAHLVKVFCSLREPA